MLVQEENLQILFVGPNNFKQWICETDPQGKPMLFLKEIEENVHDVKPISTLIASLIKVTPREVEEEIRRLLAKRGI